MLSSQLQPAPDSIDTLFEWYETGMEKLLDTYAPANIKTRPVKNRVPWYNDSIHVARRERSRVERKWRKSRSVREKKCVCELIQTAKENYFKEKTSLM